MTATIKLGQLAEFLGATLRGDPEKAITGPATLQEAGPAQLSFLANPQYRKYLADSRAAALLLKAADAEGFAGNALVVPDPYLAYARISHLFDPEPKGGCRYSSDSGMWRRMRWLIRRRASAHLR